MDNPGVKEKKSILFVDDEVLVLNGLERMLRPMRHEWSMSFAENAGDALDLLKKRHFDVVISDIRMPLMNGLQFLSEVKRLYPGIVRILLSGDAEREQSMQAVKICHQFLSKPCNAEELKSVISRIGDLSDLLEDDSIKALLSRMDSLPSLPSLYLEIENELGSNEPSIRKIGDIISRDIAMSAKILQLVNSSYFSLPRHIGSPEEAVILLGLDTITSLVLSLQIFARFDLNRLPGAYIERLWGHSINTGRAAKMIAGKEGLGQAETDYSFMAGLLHDTGKLVMASCFEAAYTRFIDNLQDREGTCLVEMEKETFGVSHAETGAYLMGLWGLSKSIVEAIAFHHSPKRSRDNRLSPLTAVYIANILEHEATGEVLGGSNYMIDQEYLSSVNIKTNYDPCNLPGISREKRR